MTAEYRILGPLEVTVDGVGVDIVGRHHPKALALLLERENQVVPHERLIEALWDQSPPKTARYQVQNVIGALRKRLAAAGEHVETAGIGYRLAIEPGRSDLSRVRGAAARAARSRRAGDLDAALTDLRGALSEWRGPALTGMTGRLLETLATQLEQLRLQILEERFGVELELGNHEAVLGELTETVVAQPLREDFHAHYLLALHRAGRTPEALRAYSELAARLARELGVGPGRRIRDLHTAILREDSRLLAAAAAPSAEPAIRPAQLPADPPGFVGRAEGLSELDALLSGDSRACVLVGAAGSGKSALAVHWSHHVRDRFPDGQLFINLRGFDRGEPVTPTEALSRFIRALGRLDAPIPADVDEAAAQYRSLMDGKRMLVVLDNARDAAQVRPLLPSGECATIVTSRNRLSGLAATEGALRVGMAPLSRAEAATMLAESLGARRLDAEPEAADRLVRLCGNLPLALRLAAARLRSSPATRIGDYVAELDGADRLVNLGIDGDPDATVAGALDFSFDALDEESARLFCALGLLPGEDFAIEMIAEVIEASEHHTLALLGRLVAAHLLEEHHAGRFRFHDLVRLYAARRAETAIDAARRDRVLERFIEWHHPQSFDVGPAEDTNLLIACEALRDHPKYWRLITPLNRVVNAGNHMEQVRELIESGLATVDAAGDDEGRFQLNYMLATYHWITGDADRSVELGRQAVDLAAGLDDARLGKATAALGHFLCAKGDQREGVKYYRRSLDLIRPGADPLVRTRRLFSLVYSYRLMGKFASALDTLFEIRGLFTPETDWLTEAREREASATLLADLGYHEDSRTIFTDVENRAKARNNRRFLSVVQLLYGTQLRRTGQYRKALDVLEQALTAARQSGDSSFEISTLCQLVRLFIDRGETGRALPHAQSLRSALESGRLNTKSIANAAQAMSKMDAACGGFERAVAYGNRSADAFASMSWAFDQFKALTDVTRAYTGLGDPDAARAVERRAAAVHAELEFPSSEQIAALRDAAPVQPSSPKTPSG